MRQHRPTVIVTGPIGSGKSLVCACFRKNGIPVYDCDSRTKDIYRRRPALVERIEEALGCPLREDGGQLDRARLAALIFSSAEVREKVEALVYPEVLKDFRRWRGHQKGAPFVVLESAVILSKPLFDGLARTVLLVTAPEELRIRRVMERDGLTREQVLSRMAAQPPIPLSAVTQTLVNDGSAAQIQQQTLSFIQRINPTQI